MPIVKSNPVSRWSRVRGPLAAVTVAGFLGVAVVAPYAMPSADAEAVAFEAAIHQEFVPNESAQADLVYTDITVKELPDPEEVRKKKEAEEKKRAEEEAAAAEESGAAPAAPSGPAAPAAPPQVRRGRLNG